ncbi:methionine aminotransferase [Taibaiella koreensis]|uniref:methionine aminotransferase n=1 Tax=Taibaiella koreensis TaxID=1268548 RepID=UPI000E5A0A93|nr:methionine aminotransferase [Taibaiella koreensis]
MIIPKYPSTGITIFSIMSALAQEHQAINLSQGFPDFPIDETLSELVAAAIKEGYNQYAPMPGLPALRQAISRKVAHFQGVDIDPDTEITITPGATYAIYTAFATLLQPGDEVIVLEPAYDSYVPNIYANSGIPVRVTLNDHDFSVDWERVFAAASTRTKAIIINNPHNPCGSTWTATDFQQLIRLVQTYGLYVFADEVYEHLVYDGKEHLSVLRFPELRERSFALYSFGKAFHCTGWKMGYCIAPPALTKAFRDLHQYLAFSVNTPMQQALAIYLEDLERLKSTTRLLQGKRDFFLEQMKDTRFRFDRPAQGSYFQVMSYEALSDLPDQEFARWLTQTHGVATIPLSSFYGQPGNQRLVRFCFAKKESTLEAAAARLSVL